MSPHAGTLASLCRRTLSVGAMAARNEILREVVGREARWTRERLASLPRIIGRELLAGGVEEIGGAVVAVGSYRACDAVAAELLVLGAPAWEEEGALRTLYSTGDAEERRMILKALPFVATAGAEIVRLLEEAHRTNDQTIFEAGLLDSDLPARVLPDADWNRVVLKAAFLDLPAVRLLRWEERANATLSRMLLDFQRERLAAGRKVWADTAAMVERAPG